PSLQNSFHEEVIGLLSNLRYDKEQRRNVTKKKKLNVEPRKSIAHLGEVDNSISAEDDYDHEEDVVRDVSLKSIKNVAEVKTVSDYYEQVTGWQSSTMMNSGSP
uniref:Uncharacterized protein n=1 Tax=Romanomermis culicivorax TaxID=13658 RepID=A0A915K2Y0_ROMCU